MREITTPFFAPYLFEPSVKIAKKNQGKPDQKQPKSTKHEIWSKFKQENVI